MQILRLHVAFTISLQWVMENFLGSTKKKTSLYNRATRTRGNPDTFPYEFWYLNVCLHVNRSFRVAQCHPCKVRQLILYGPAWGWLKMHSCSSVPSRSQLHFFLSVSYNHTLTEPSSSVHFLFHNYIALLPRWSEGHTWTFHSPDLASCSSQRRHFTQCHLENQIEY